MINKIIGVVTYLMSYVIPVNRNLIVFHSFPNYGDNSYAVFKYLAKFRPGHYHYVWLIDDPDVEAVIRGDVLASNIDDRVDILFRKSIYSIWMCYRALHIFTTVGLFVKIHFRQTNKRINMWHGMPLKSIFSGNNLNGDYTIATSNTFVPYMSKGLNIKEENVLVLGQPRNDMLFHPELLHPKYAALLEGFEHVGIWMPTFRRSKIGRQYSDGLYKDNGISFVSFDDLPSLNRSLRALNTLLIIKLHPLDILQECEISSYSNIIVFKSDNFEQRYMYSLLSRCDFLLSDFSSVVIDYEILNRPIGIVIDDYDSYKNTRGLFPIEIPGVRINELDGVISFIGNIENLEQKEINTYYNMYKDDNSTERLVNYFDL